MASLVADYGAGSDSEPDSGHESNPGCDQPLHKLTTEEVQNFESSAVTTGTGNLLMGGPLLDSDSSEDEVLEPPVRHLNQTTGTGNISKLPNPLSARNPLPTPTLSDNQTEKVNVKNSVFANPFLEAETAKQSILEKHVKLTVDEAQDQKSGKPRKQVCYKFKKGKCNFGTKCKYSHDLDNVTGNVQGQQQTDKPKQMGQSSLFYGNPLQDVTPILEDDDSYMGQAKKKRKFGVTDTLNPPKKALKQLEQKRASDRPWTVKR